MKIISNQPIINFYGVKSPYRADNMLIYPIERDITPEDISAVKKCITDDRLLGQGLNGKVYRINDEYVVKVPVQNRLTNESIMQETKKLDMLYDFSKEKCIDLQNSQRGIASVFTDSGEEYLITTYVKGTYCDKSKNRLNKHNIDSVMRILTELDIGSKKYGRMMSYDYNGDNVNFTKKSAGLLDFEYLKGNLLEVDIPNRILSGRKSLTPHLSDTSPLTSNVRTFEYGTLYHYLISSPPKHAAKIFRLYLNRKSLYHNKMSDYYAKRSEEGLYSDIFKELAKREKNHSNLLNNKNLTEDIIKSEAIKIQLSEFIYRTSGSSIRGDFNPYQIIDYYNDSVKYFKNKFREARKSKDYNLASYYYDCMKTLDTWTYMKYVVFDENSKSRRLFSFEKTLDAAVKNDRKLFSNLLKIFSLIK